MRIGGRPVAAVDNLRPELFLVYALGSAPRPDCVVGVEDRPRIEHQRVGPADVVSAGDGGGIEAELARLGEYALMPDPNGGPGKPREVAVVMHVPDSMNTPVDYKPYLLTDDQEEALKRRFKKVDDPLCFIVVTAK